MYCSACTNTPSKLQALTLCNADTYKAMYNEQESVWTLSLLCSPDNVAPQFPFTALRIFFLIEMFLCHEGQTCLRPSYFSNLWQNVRCSYHNRSFLGHPVYMIWYIYEHHKHQHIKRLAVHGFRHWSGNPNWQTSPLKRILSANGLLIHVFNYSYRNEYESIKMAKKRGSEGRKPGDECGNGDWDHQRGYNSRTTLIRETIQWRP